MSKILSKNGYGILMNSIQEEEIKDLKENLTVKPIAFADYDFGADTAFEVYRLSDKYFYMPKYFGLERYGPPDKNIEKDGSDLDNLSFVGQLKDHQVDYCKTLLEQTLENGSCIAHSTTGSGKTTMALWMISQLKKRTLILVHKQFLMNQWKERIEQFLPGASIGIIKRDKCETDKDITIGMIQTLLKRNYSGDTFNSFNYSIIDEAHHVCAKTFSQILYKCKTKYTLALSATVKRQDGLTRVLEWFCGNIITNKILSDVEKPDVKLVDAIYSTDIVVKFNFNGTKNSADLVNKLVVDPARNDIIIKEIMECLKINRKILVLSGRVQHCKNLKNMMPKNVHSSLYLGSMKIEKLNESNKADVIFATYQAAAEAYDNPALDTLIMATGMSNVQQSVGRILRRKNRHKPLIIDITDKEFLYNQAKKRKQFYKSCDFNILNEKKIKKIEETEECLFR